MKKPIFTILLLALASFAFGQVPENEYKVEQLSNGTLMIKGFVSSYREKTYPNVETLTIPSQLFGIRVTRISDYAFDNMDGITQGNFPALVRIIMPDTVTVIGENAFYNMMGYFPKNLREIRIPRSVVAIGGSAFYSTVRGDRLKVVIPSSVRSLGSYSFGTLNIAELVIESVITEFANFSSGSTVFNTQRNNVFEKITFPANWNNDQTLDRLGLPTNFVNYYKSQGRKGGVYVKNGQIWTLSSAAPASEPYGGIFNLSPPPQAAPPAPAQRPIAPEMVRIRGFEIRNSTNNTTITTTSFFIGKYEVSQNEWSALMGGESGNNPKTGISWFEAVEYCNRLSQSERLTPAYTINGTNVTWNQRANGYRLPTKTEWENAAGLNLYEMSGNVWDWCWDWDGNYPSGSLTDPTGPSSGSRRVIFRGEWSSGSLTSSRTTTGELPSTKKNDLGFRLARNLN